MRDDDLSVVPIGPEHIEGLREACSKDREIWKLYPISFDPSSFDHSLSIIREKKDWTVFAIAVGDLVVGMTSFVRAGGESASLDIGATYLEPAHRGTGLNWRVKRLMINRAKQAGFAQILFKIDSRNLRSRRAVEKLGARLDAVIERDFAIWTGHVRDTAIYRLDLCGSGCEGLDCGEVATAVMARPSENEGRHGASE